ncbi:MAG: ATP-dependent Clp protease ATP-binding subunit ClpX [Lachnospiraceae bacterium]|nr:ATP-dependent Clp protease ATP-binding subunit ClpX [Lachnospiraceae bacterium]
MNDNEQNKQELQEAEVKQEESKKNHSGRRCLICGREEGPDVRLLSLPNGVCFCEDCMQEGMNSFQEPPEMHNIFQNLPDLSFLNLNDLIGGPRRNFGKKKKTEKQEEKQQPHFEMKTIMHPHRIKAGLDAYVVGQEHAKKVLSVAVYNHYKRIIAEEKRLQAAEQDSLADVKPPVEIEKSNVLMLGPTGSGKTYLVKTLARLLDVPLAITDATSLTEAGYIGDDIESVVSKLLAAADNDVERAEHGIIFVDEIDKIAKKKNTNQRDVSGEAVQQGMLKLLEGAEVEVPVGATSKNAMVPLVTVNTKNILFIVGGAFPGLNDIIKERLTQKSSIGFQADLRDRFDNEKNLLQRATTEDLRKFGMIPEFLGRLPILCPLEALTEEMMIRILCEPENAILKQYEALLAMDEVRLTFEEEALSVIAKKALEMDTGARALRSILEEFMLEIMYEIPKDESIGEVVITADYLNHKGSPRILLRGMRSLGSGAN